MYPRAIASIGSGFNRRTTIARPATWSRSPGATTDSGSMPVRWFGMTCFSFSNQK